MGFINQKIPNDENLVYDIPHFRPVELSQRTIDVEKDVFMFNYWTNIDYPDEEYFALYWKGICFDIIMEKSFLDGYTIKWELCSIEQLDHEDKVVNLEEVKKDLRDAFMVYGVRGFEYKVPNAVPHPDIKVVLDID